MGGWAVAVWAVSWGWRRLAAEQVWCSRTSWEGLQPLNPVGVVDTDLWGGAGRRADHSSSLKILSKRQNCSHAVTLSEPVVLRAFWIRECCGSSVPWNLPLLGHWWQSYTKQRYHGETAWPGESGLMVSSQAAVESCHRNWLAVLQACALSSLLGKNTSVTNHLRLGNTPMPCSVKPWGEQALRLHQGKLRAVLYPAGHSLADVPWDELTAPALHQSLPGGGPQTLGVLIKSSCGFFSRENNRRENWTECAQEGKPCLALWDAFGKRCFQVSAWEFLTYFLYCIYF